MMKPIVWVLFFLVTVAMMTSLRGDLYGSMGVLTCTSPDGNLSVRFLWGPQSDLAQGSVHVAELIIQPGTPVSAHQHANATEIVYVISGTGKMTLGDRTWEFTAGERIVIPPGISHALEATGKSAIQAIQVYDPAGPEKRFKDWNCGS